MKKNFKRLAVLLATLLITTGIFAKTELTFWHGVEAPENVKLLQDKASEFMKANPDIVINLQSFGASDQVNQKIMTALKSNSQPDLMWWGNQTTGVLASTGTLVEISSLIAADKSFNKSDIPDGLWEACTYNGKIYGVPFGANNLAIYYNKDLFKKAGLDPKKIVTWDDFIDAAKKLTKDGVMGFEMPIGKNEWTVWTWQTFLWSNGGEFLSDNNTKPAFNSQAGVEALQYWVDLVAKYKVASFSEPDAGYKPDNFLAGKVAMMINGPWNKPVLEKQTSIKYGVLPIPMKKRKATNLGGENLYIFKSNKDKETAAWKFAKFIMSPKFQVSWANASGYLPTCKSAANDAEYKKFLAGNEFVKAYFDNAQYGKARPPIAAYNNISAAVGKAIEKALYQKQSPKDALDEAAKEAANELADQ